MINNIKKFNEYVKCMILSENNDNNIFDEQNVSNEIINFLLNTKFIYTNKNRIDEYYDEDDDEYNQKLAYEINYINSWYYADNTNPDTEVFDDLTDAFNDIKFEGKGEADKYYSPYKQIDILLKECWIYGDDIIYEYTNKNMSYNDFYDYNKNNEFCNKIGGYIDNIGFKQFEYLEKNADILLSEVYFNINNDIIKKYDDYNISVIGNSKYRTIIVSDNDDNEILSIKLRIANHSYNPSNNDDDARNGKFISIEIANKNETKNKYHGKYGLEFNGYNTYSDVIDAVNDRIVEILEKHI